MNDIHTLKQKIKQTISDPDPHTHTITSTNSQPPAQNPAPKFLKSILKTSTLKFNNRKKPQIPEPLRQVVFDPIPKIIEVQSFKRYNNIALEGERGACMKCTIA